MARSSVLQSFYASAPWQNFRIMIIVERGLVCEHCKEIISNPREVTIHHIKELTSQNVFDVSVALNPANVMLIHRNCHDQIHKRFGHSNNKKVYLVYGCPLSGKTSYVEQSIGRNDIVVDMNSLYQAISGLPAYDKPDVLLGNVRAVYKLLIDHIKTRYGKWGTAYVVGGFPDHFSREHLADELGAELVFCDCGKDEAISRIDADELRRSMREEYIGYINQWFEEYSE